MEYNSPSEIVKNLNFGDDAKNKVIMGVEKLSKAVKSTLGASGKCVIYEDARGNPVITKDGVTVAESVVLFDPVENMGATLVKEAARNTVREAGDGTTTATVLAEALLKEVNKPEYSHMSTRSIKDGISSALKKVNKYLDDTAIEVKDSMLDNVASISCNNDVELGKIISEAYTKVGKDGVVFMEESETEETYVDVVEGIQLDNGLTSPHFITNQDKQKAELENPYVLIVSSEIPTVRKIQSILEHVIKKGRALLIVAPVSQQVKSALLMNKVKGNIKVNIIDLPGFGPTKRDTTEDLAIATGATVINEELGDDLDIISIEHLGEVERSITDSKTTVITTSYDEDLLKKRINSIKELIKNEKNPFLANKQKKRIAMLKGNVGMIYVGADTKVELKEKKDRVEDAIYATKAALQEGIVPGGGVALLNAAQELFGDKNEEILLNAIRSPFHTILNNGGIEIMEDAVDNPGFGVNVINGKRTNMVKNGIVDPVLVTKSALKNAVSVVTTIISADCVISNMRGDESDK
jgi:chaperonin GroEL